MKLLCVVVKNYRSFIGEFTFHFDRAPGLYYVTGDNKERPEIGANGVGKSTLLIDAVYWCLTGETIRSRKPGSAVEPWSGERPTEVTVIFENSGARHVVKRTRHPNSLTVDGDVVIQARVSEVVGVPYELLRRTILLAQFGRLFLDMKAEEQSDMFTEVLNLDLWLRAAKSAASLASEAFKDAETYRTTADTLRGRLAEVRENLAQAQEAHPTAAPAKPDGRRPEGRLSDIQARLRKAEREEAVQAANVKRLKERKADYAPQTKVCPECGQKVSTKHVSEKRGELDNQSARAEALAVKAQTSIDALQEQVAALQAWVAYDDALAEYEEAAGAVAALTERIKTLQDQHQEAVDKRLEAMLEHDGADYWAKAFREIRLSIIESVLGELQMSCAKHVEALGLSGWEIRFATERETASGTISTRFIALIYPPHVTDPIPWESYSGGESQRLQLAATFALGEVLLARAGMEPNVEVLDEPTQHLSQEGIDSLLECLADRAQDLKRAIYLIDHRSLDRGSFKGVIKISDTSPRIVVD